jgi:hypothetical protein
LCAPDERSVVLRRQAANAEAEHAQAGHVPERVQDVQRADAVGAQEVDVKPAARVSGAAGRVGATHMVSARCARMNVTRSAFI